MANCLAFYSREEITIVNVSGSTMLSNGTRASAIIGQTDQLLTITITNVTLTDLSLSGYYDRNSGVLIGIIQH